MVVVALATNARADGYAAASYTLGTDGGSLALWGAGSYRKRFYLGGELAFSASTPDVSLLFVGGWRKRKGRFAVLADAGLGFTEAGGYDFFGDRGWFHDEIMASGALRVHGMVRFYRSPDRLDLNLAITADARTTFDGDAYGAAAGLALVIVSRPTHKKKKR